MNAKAALMSVVLVLMIAVTASAADFYGGVSYNTVDIGDLNELVGGTGFDEVKSVWGYHAGFVFDVMGIPAGIEIDQLSFKRDGKIDGVEAEVSASTFGIGPVLALSLVEAETVNVTAATAAMWYSAKGTVDSKTTNDEDDDSSFGFKITGNIQYMLTDAAYVTGRVGYRSVKHNLNLDGSDVNLDWSGLELAAGFSILF